MHATDFLRQPSKQTLQGIVVLHGSERHLKHGVLNALCGEFLSESLDAALGLVRYSGKEADMKTVRDDLLMVSMFTPRKIVSIDQADDFVTQSRAALETYLEQPSSKALLVLDVKSWRKNTKLAKILEKSGVDVDCSELTGGKLIGWLVQQAKEEHGKQLARDAAQWMAEVNSGGMGQLDQELAKLAAFVGEEDNITLTDAQKLIGGWKQETTWSMIDAIRDGRVPVALACLHRLMQSGEAAPKILGGLNFVFRKLAIAVETSRGGRGLRDALQQAGVFPRDVAAAEKYLRRIKRGRAERILERLAQADQDLKGESRLPEQLQMELLILWLSGVGIPS